MSEQVKVEDIAVFGLFRVAMLKFAQTADSSLSNADSTISRTQSWLETEQRTYWESQLRKRADLVTQAREAVRQKKLFKDASGRTPGAVEEEKHLAKCIAAAEHAKQKLENVRRALPRFQKEADMYRSGVARLANLLTSDIPRATALLERLAVSLEQYTQIEAPVSDFTTSAAPNASEGSVSRGGDTATEPAPATPAAPAPAKLEDRHVADGQ